MQWTTYSYDAHAPGFEPLMLRWKTSASRIHSRLVERVPCDLEHAVPSFTWGDHCMGTFEQVLNLPLLSTIKWCLFLDTGTKIVSLSISLNCIPVVKETYKYFPTSTFCKFKPVIVKHNTQMLISTNHHKYHWFCYNGLHIQIVFFQFTSDNLVLKRGQRRRQWQQRSCLHHISNTQTINRTALLTLS